ncbi:MAG: PD-(D/E)XK nuclease family protein [Bacillota bacterium]|nr:PD-(D/E)XK nuclease family protein [Bacillota bacterium]MDW7677570.1 PD-(D/E)XK nuclease family protein [Bacillota bacterium]
MLELLMGRQVEAKSRWMYRKIDAAVEQNSMIKHLIIVPEQFTVQAEKAYLEATRRTGLMNPEVMSFNRLAYRIFQETGGRTRVLVDDLGKHMLVRKILMKLENDLTVYRGLSRERGLVERIVESITECKQYEINADDLQKQASFLEERSLLKRKLLDLALIFRHYENDLEGRYVDQEDQFLALITQMKQASSLQETVCWIDGFFSYTPRMLAVIMELVQQTSKVRLTAYGKAEWLVNEKEPLIHQILKLQMQLWRLGTKTLVTDTEPLVAAADRASCLDHLSTYFNHLPIKTWNEKTDELTLFAAANDDSEVEQIAARIQELVQDQRYRYREIAVLCADLEQRQDSIKRFFTLQEIPFFLDVRRKKIEHPLIQLIPALLENMIKGYSYQSMFSYLKTGFSGISQEELEQLENEVLARGIHGADWKKDFSLYDRADQTGIMNHLRRRIMKPLMHFEAQLNQSSTVRQMTEALFSWMDRAAIAPQVEKEITSLSKLEDVETAAMLTQLWNRMMDLSDQLVEMIGEVAISLKEYRQLWQTGLDAIEIGLIPPTVDQVMVGTPERSRQAGIRALFLIGINDGVLPAVQSEDGLFLMIEKQELQQKGCLMGVVDEFRQAQESLTIQLALSRPKDYLWLSYSQASIEGETRRPSVLLDRIRKIFPGVSYKNDLFIREDEEFHLLHRPGYSYLKLASKLRELAEGKPVSDQWVQLFYWFQNQEQWRTDCEKMITALFYQHQPFNLNRRRAEGLFGSRYQGSVSRLEQYNRCPFAHFVRFGLLPTPRKKQEIMAPDMGNVLHQIMESFGKHLQTQQPDPLLLNEEQVTTLNEKLAGGIIRNYENGIFDSTRRFHFYGERLKRISRRAIDTMIYHLKKSGFEPSEHEIIFGSDDEKQLLPLQIEAPNGNVVLLEGRIDRLDICLHNNKRYFRVIDYKSGRQSFSYLELMHGLQLQLIVYLMAVLDKDANPHNTTEMKPAGMLYFYLDDPMVEMEQDDPQKVESRIRQELKMDGVVLKDLSIIQEMDRELLLDSDVLPVGLTQTGDFKRGSRLLTEEEFSLLQHYARMQIGMTASSILSGAIKAAPAQLKKWKACDHCEYGSVCQYDPVFVDSRPRILSSLKDEEALRLMIQQMIGKGSAE